MKKMTYEDCMVHASGDFLCETFPDTAFLDKPEEEIHRFIDEHIWSPFESCGYSPENMFDLIECAADALYKEMQRRDLAIPREERAMALREERAMTLNELIRIASSYYDDDMIAQYWDEKQQFAYDTGAGDTLALFVARELADTFDKGAPDDVKLRLAAEAVHKSAAQLTELAEALSDKGKERRKCVTR